MHRRTLLLAPALAALTLTACGTTVPLDQQLASGSAAAGGGLGAAPGGPVAAAAAPGSTDTGAAGTQAGSTTTAGRQGSSRQPAAGPGSPGTAPLAAPSALPATGPGWDSKHVFIGVLTQKDTASAFKSVGYSGIDPGDTEAQTRAVIAAVNQQGGVLGRQLVPDFVDVPTVSSASNPDQAANEVCTHYTQDHRVVAVVNLLVTLDVDSFRSCLTRNKIVLWDAADVATDSTDQKRFAPYFYNGVVPAWDVLAPFLTDRLTAQGYFGGWDALTSRSVAGKKPKVGVLVLDSPLGARIGSTIKKALAARGYDDVVSFAYTYPGNNIQPAISYFSGNNVTHVISADIELAAFQVNANAQRYYPRYGINSYNIPFHNLESVAPAAQQNGAVGIGWAPAYDVSDQKDPGVIGPGQAACLKATRSVQQPGRLAKAFTLNLCDGIGIVALAANRSGGLLAPDLYRGIMAVAPQFRSAVTFASAIGPSRLFVPAAARDLAWSSQCSCYSYVSSQSRRF